ncbi:unnamed protein product [Lampetra fluviatilis]
MYVLLDEAFPWPFPPQSLSATTQICACRTAGADLLDEETGARALKVPDEACRRCTLGIALRDEKRKTRESSEWAERSIGEVTFLGNQAAALRAWESRRVFSIASLCPTRSSAPTGLNLGDPVTIH